MYVLSVCVVLCCVHACVCIHKNEGEKKPGGWGGGGKTDLRMEIDSLAVSQLQLQCHVIDALREVVFDQLFPGLCVP